MTIDQIKKVRELAGNRLLVVIMDNQHIYYDNMKDSIPLAWDDENEILIGFHLNTYDVYVQEEQPIMICFSSYDEIQRMEIAVTASDASKIVQDYYDQMQNGSLTDAKKKYIQKFIANTKAIRTMHNKSI